MSIDKHTVFLSIDQFISEVPEKDYPLYFSAEEIKRYGHRRNKGSLAVRFALKQKLKEIFKTIEPANQIEILDAENGQPILHWPQAPHTGIHISLSHARKKVAALIIIEKHAD